MYADPDPSGRLTVRLSQLETLRGATLGPSRPVVIDHERILAFAEVTDDRNWIHTDPQRAARSPSGSPIAHGLLTLSLGTSLLNSLLEVTDADRCVYSGIRRVRFLRPVRSGARLRLTACVSDVRRRHAGRRLALDLSFDVERDTAPVCTASIVLWFTENEDRRW